MNKKVIYTLITVVILSILFLTGCGKSVTVKDDLSKFDQKVTNIINDFKSQTSKIGTTIDTVDGLIKLQGNMVDVQRKFKDIEVDTKEVKDLKKQFVTAFDKVLQGVDDYIQSTKNHDKALYDKADKIGKEGSKELNDFFADAKELAKKEGLTLKMKEIQ